MVRHGVEQGPALTLTQRIAPVILVVAAFYAAMVTIRIHEHSVLWFVHLGRTYVTAAHTSHEIGPQLGWQSRYGYDGQYYFGVAVDPVHAKDYMGDRAGAVYARPFFPLAAGVLGGSSTRIVPSAMLAIELAAVLAATLAAALWLRRRALSPWPAALFGLYPGLVFPVFRDLTEPLAYALAAFGLLALDRRRAWLGALLLALAVLTREAAFPFALAGAALLAQEHRRWRPPLAFAAATLLPAIVWRLLVPLWTEGSTGQSTSPIPFAGFTAWPFDQQHRLVFAVVVVPALLAAVAGVAVVRRTPVFAALLVANVLLYVVFLSKPNDIDWGSAGRDALPCILAALYCMGSSGRRVLFWPALALWSMPAFLLVARYLDLPGLDLMTL